MAAASTSKQPLVYKARKQNKSWWTRKASPTLAKLNPARLWNGSGKPKIARSIYINSELPSSMFDKKGRMLKDYIYPSNQNVTSKYTIITFLPRNLFEQFRRIANIFFLAIAILQFFPKFSTISPGLVILPLLAVLGITALKDGYEDIKRHQADHKVNHSIVHVLKGPGYENKNKMASKSKTFVPAIPLPRKRSKKAKKGEKQTTDALEQVVPEVREPRPQGDADGNRLRQMQSRVSNWEEDPEAGDEPNELGWHRTIWEDVKVGDIVKIYDNEQFPAGE
jgi:phospholipid-translocating ATPase